MDYAYFATGWLPHQYFEPSCEPMISNILDSSDCGPRPSAERTRDYILDSLTLHESLVRREQQDTISVALSQNFKHDLTFSHSQEYSILPQSPAELSPLAPYFPSIIAVDDKSPQPVASYLKFHESRLKSSSVEEEIMSPRRCRRKAQNRAAQRAFRERKEIRIRALEAELKKLRNQSVLIIGENNRLRKELARMATWREGLRLASGCGSDEAGLCDDPQCVHDHNQNSSTGSVHLFPASTDVESD